MSYEGETLVFYKGYSNAKVLEFKEGGAALSNFENITKVRLLFKGKWYDSEDYPMAFDFTTYALTSKLILKLGLIPNIDATKDTKAELILYDPGHPQGQVTVVLPIKVIQLTGVESAE